MTVLESAASCFVSVGQVKEGEAVTAETCERSMDRIKKFGHPFYTYFVRGARGLGVNDWRQRGGSVGRRRAHGMGSCGREGRGGTERLLHRRVRWAISLQQSSMSCAAECLAQRQSCRPCIAIAAARHRLSGKREPAIGRRRFFLLWGEALRQSWTLCTTLPPEPPR